MSGKVLICCRLNVCGWKRFVVTFSFLFVEAGEVQVVPEATHDDDMIMETANYDEREHGRSNK